ncbi:MAG: AAA family ATPase [Alphaproteobacteria bacterium]|nr:AAA family ATPase [Alphaproteobacteria bacterium]
MFPLNMYYPNFETINHIRFTRREIDIIACILNGRSAKTIPSLLSISPKTVAAHMENIRAKAGCSSRESIIDFIESSEKSALIKNEYYADLLARSLFEKSLKEISKIVASQEIICTFIFKQEHNGKNSFLHTLEQHLKLAGFKVENKNQTGYNFLQDIERSQPLKYNICILPEADPSNEDDAERNEWAAFIPNIAAHRDKFIFLNTKGNTKTLKQLDKFHCIDFSAAKNYYFSFIKILKVILSSKSVDKILNDLTQYLASNQYASNSSPILESTNSRVRKNKFWPKIIGSYVPSLLLTNRRSIRSIAALSFVAIFYLIFLTSKEFIWKNEYNSVDNSIRSDLSVPHESAFLTRSDLIKQIDRKFNERRGIQSLALIGIGGAGKTTLARQYARQQKAAIIWEINAESREDLNLSFGQLAFALAKTDKEQSALRTIQSLKEPEEKEEKLLQFVKTRLKACPNWVLIFDNVEKLNEIQKYFPQDTSTWGVGKVIVTTRDHNLQNNNRINHVLFMGKLDPDQKLNLFTQIMSHNTVKFFTVNQKDDAKQFLKHIPPFPLDVTVAAYYLKVANISYAEYIENIKQHKEDFENFQISILKEFGGYSKTRYNIIALSLKKIISESNDFSDLFFLLSLLNAHHIPRDLLEKY